MADEPLIRNVSDTALWVARYRAMESERPDALFYDPYAQTLAGERGREIVETLPWGRRTSWSMVVRTQVLDELILEAVERDGFDSVLNLGCGLDTRPYRLALPAALRWVEVDLPGMIEYKSAALKDARAFCRLERQALDLADKNARRRLFERVGAAANRVLVITEDLLVYLDEPLVKALAADLHDQPTFKRWLTDLGSAAALKMARRLFSKHSVSRQVVGQFGPKQHVEFFRPLGWTPTAFHSMWDDARRLHRHMRGAAFVNLLMMLTPGGRAAGRKMVGVVVLERS